MSTASLSRPGSTKDVVDTAEIKASFASSGFNDDERPGRISWSELRRLLLEGNPNFPERLLNVLFKEYGKDQDVGIDFNNFVDSCFDVETPVASGKEAGAEPKSAKPLQILIVCDPGPDPDDCKVLLVATYLQRQGALLLKGVVCNGGHQAKERAKLAKTVLRSAGAPDVPVAIGSPGQPRSPQPHEYDIDGYDHVSDQDLEDGDSLILSVLRQAEPKSLCVQVQAGMTDVAAVMKAERDLFCSKVAVVSVQAGLKAVDESEAKSDVPIHCYGWAADSSQNNVYDVEAAQFVFGFCFDHGLELRAVGRLAVPGIPMALADSFSEGCAVLKYLANCQRCGLAGLWEKVCAGTGLPPHCNKQWFFSTFCGVDAEEYAAKYEHVGSESDIGKYLNGSVKPYDLVAFMSLLSHYSEAFDFKRAAVKANGVQHFLFLNPENAIPVNEVIELLTAAFTDICKLSKL